MHLQSATSLRERGFAAGLPRAATRRQRAARRPLVLQSPSAFMTRHDPAVLQATVERFVDCVNRQDLASLGGLLDPNVVWSDRVWSSNDLVGQRKVRLVYQELFGCYPDHTVHTEELLARGDANTVALHFTARGTCFGEWRGFPASGRRSTYSGVMLFVFDGERDDRIKQVVTYRQPTAEEYAYYLGHEDL